MGKDRKVPVEFQNLGGWGGFGFGEAVMAYEGVGAQTGRGTRGRLKGHCVPGSGVAVNVYWYPSHTQRPPCPECY